MTTPPMEEEDMPLHLYFLKKIQKKNTLNLSLEVPWEPTPPLHDSGPVGHRPAATAALPPPDSLPGLQAPPPRPARAFY